MFKGWIRTSLIDFPDKIASILFTSGCDFRCPMCHNASLVLEPGEYEDIDENEIWQYLEKRKNTIDGIVISGGEPTLHPRLTAFLEQARRASLSIKLDTNGYHPEKLANLINKNLVDYIAMDIKAPREKYALLSGLPDLDIEKIEKSIHLIRNAGISYEFRTTVVPGLLDKADIAAIADWLQGSNRYILQQFRAANTLDTNLQQFSPYPVPLLEEMASLASKKISDVKVRGI